MRRGKSQKKKGMDKEEEGRIRRRMQRKENQEEEYIEIIAIM
jgi:hypothetical protein